MKNINDAITFYDLEWDTNYFGVTSAKAILHKPLILEDWNKLKHRFKHYQFISIENRNSDPTNAQIIGTDTSAFLADVNIQFIKKTGKTYYKPKNIGIYHTLERNEEIIKMANFQFSKFIEDPELAKRGGDKVYYQWLINSFDRPDKYYALSIDKNDNINGFLLFSYLDNTCRIELIAVSQKRAKRGIGTNLFKTVECAAYQQGCNEIKVGTQIRNTGAINFYNKVGFKQVACHQIYHLWN